MSEIDLKRRKLMKGGTIGALTATAFITGYKPVFKKILTSAATDARSDVTELNKDVTLVRSICLQCHSGCGIQGKVFKRGTEDAVLLKIDGNPYHANTYQPHLDFNTDLESAKLHVGSICAKGQAGIQTLYDPNRLKFPLKRKGPRGSKQWERLTWDQFYKEIIEGAALDKQEGGAYNFEGMLDLLVDDNIDDDKPWLGSKRNQIVYLVGRSEHGRKELSDRIFGSIFGTINKRIDHTSICEQSHHIGFKEVSTKTHMKPDFDEAEVVIVFGGSYLDANFPFSANVPKVMRFKERGGKLIVVDPRFSNTAKHADLWLPLKPGTDAALALAIANVIFENDLYNDAYLQVPNLDAANGINEVSCTNGTWLVNISSHDFVTMQDVGLANAGDDDADNAVVWNGSNYEDGTIATSGQLFPGEITLPLSDKAKTGIELYKDEALSKTLDDWLEICGLEDFKTQIVDLSFDFAESGKKSVADLYRGAVQHTNGYYNAISIILLNLLVGSVDWKGGLSKGGSHYHEMGTTVGNTDTTYIGLEKLGTTASSSGWKITKEGISWGPGNGEYDDRVAGGETNPLPERPFYPKTSQVWQEVFSAIDANYPYRAKHVWNHMGNPNYSVPGANKVQEILTKVDSNGDYIIPVLISVDVVMGETSAYSDYVLPDVTYLERFASTHVAPSQQTTISAIRQPMFGQYDPTTGDYQIDQLPGYEECKMAEDIYIELALKLKNDYGFNFDGIGENAFGFTPSDSSFPSSLNNAWDWYKAILINLIEEVELKGITVEGSTMNEKIEYVLDRGGIFEDFSAYENSGDKLPHQLKKVLKLWSSSVATKTHSFSGEKFWGTARYEEIMDMKGNKVLELDKSEGYNLQLITYKLPIHTQSRTASNEFLRELLQENGIEINEDDAKSQNIETGDKIRMVSKSNLEGVEGVAFVTNLHRPGVVAVTHAFGHTQYGASGWKEDGKKIKGNSWIAGGVNSNLVMRLDESYLSSDGSGAVSLTDPIGGSASFFDTMVKIIKI